MRLVKLFLLNIIMLYFLKYNINFSFILLFIVIIYNLILNNKNVIEGNNDNKNMEDAKKKLEHIEMIKIDGLLDDLIGKVGSIRKNCKGMYSEYSACDKKCGKDSYKYKIYNIIEQAGVDGNECDQVDGFRKKKLCDESDGISLCKYNDPCEKDEDCISGRCDPDKKTCYEKLCDNENLQNCNESLCNNLNNIYSYDDKKYVYETNSTNSTNSNNLTDKICKLKLLTEID